MSRPYALPLGPTRLADSSTSIPPPEPRSSTVSPARSSASAVGLPHPREAATALTGSSAVSVAVYRLDVIGSTAASLSRHELPEQQEASPPATTLSAAFPYLFFTICLMSWSAMAWSPVTLPRLRGAVRRRAAGVRPGEGKLRRHIGLAGRHLRLVLEVVVQVVHLPLDAVRILDPELVLVGMAAVHTHLLAHRQPGRLDASELRHHFGRG